MIEVFKILELIAVFLNGWIQRNMLLICALAYLVVIFFVPRHYHKTVFAQDVPQHVYQIQCLECVK
jgi:hypothetical protein